MSWNTNVRRAQCGLELSVSTQPRPPNPAKSTEGNGITSRGARVKDWMSIDVPYVHVWEDAQRAADLMDESNLKHLSVVDGSKRFLGVISEKDILSIAIILAADSLTPIGKKGLDEICLTARDVMDRDSRAISADEDINNAAAMLLENGRECLPVVHDSKFVGMLSHTDFARMVASAGEVAKRAA